MPLRLSIAVSSGLGNRTDARHLLGADSIGFALKPAGDHRGADHVARRIPARLQVLVNTLLHRRIAQSFQTDLNQTPQALRQVGNDRSACGGSLAWLLSLETRSFWHGANVPPPPAPLALLRAQDRSVGFRWRRDAPGARQLQLCAAALRRAHRHLSLLLPSSAPTERGRATQARRTKPARPTRSLPGSSRLGRVRGEGARDGSDLLRIRRDMTLSFRN